jgi:hypothetical protein
LFKDANGGYGKGQADAISSHIEKYASAKDKKVVESK